MDITITLSQEEYDALTVLTVTPEEWVQHAAKNKARKMIDTLILEYSDKRPDKISDQEKKDIINGIDLAEEKNKRNPRI